MIPARIETVPVAAVPVAGRGGATGWPRALWLVGTVLLVTLLVHLVALVLGGGPWTGPVSLRKPATFAGTGWLVCWSVAVILPVLRTRAWQRHVVGTATVLFALGETAIIGVQAWRGVPSHYNFTTPLDVALMRGGAAGTAGVFIAGMLVLLVATTRSRTTPAAVRLGVLGGLAVLLFGCAVGLVMIFNNSGVFQGSIGVGFTERTSGYLGPDPATVGTDYLLVRPATAGGDLVLLHAIGVHGLALLAVPAVLLARTALPQGSGLRLVALAVTALLGGLALLAGHAFAQVPWNQLGAPAAVAIALCAAMLLGAYGAVARALYRTRTVTAPEADRS